MGPNRNNNNNNKRLRRIGQIYKSIINTVWLLGQIRESVSSSGEHTNVRWLSVFSTELWSMQEIGGLKQVNLWDVKQIKWNCGVSPDTGLHVR